MSSYADPESGYKYYKVKYKYKVRSQPIYSIRQENIEEPEPVAGDVIFLNGDIVGIFAIDKDRVFTGDSRTYSIIILPLLGKFEFKYAAFRQHLVALRKLKSIANSIAGPQHGSGQSEPMTKVVERKYWPCDTPEHRHRKKETADKCITKKYKTNERPSARDILLRDIGIARRVMSGEKSASVARDIGVSRSRIASITSKILGKIFYAYSGELVGDGSARRYERWGYKVTENKMHKNEILPLIDRFERDKF